MIQGRVVHGEGRGHGLGVPTVNLAVEEVELEYGVYAVWVDVYGLKLSGVMNWGARPSFKEEEPRMEVHLLDFEGDLYDEELSVGVVQRLRGVKRFDSKEELVAQIEKDIAMARELL